MTLFDGTKPSVTYPAMPDQTVHLSKSATVEYELNDPDQMVVPAAAPEISANRPAQYFMIASSGITAPSTANRASYMYAGRTNLGHSASHISDAALREVWPPPSESRGIIVG